MEIRLGKTNDISNWMELVNDVKQNFPGLETKQAIDEHKNTVLDFMDRESAICAVHDDKIIGILLFSKKEGVLCFLAVDVNFRRQHIAQKMFCYMLNLIEENKDIIVSTYREDSSDGNAARRFYKHLGFVEGKLTEEFGYPVQEFILKR